MIDNYKNKTLNLHKYIKNTENFHEPRAFNLNESVRTRFDSPNTSFVYENNSNKTSIAQIISTRNNQEILKELPFTDESDKHLNIMDKVKDRIKQDKILRDFDELPFKSDVIDKSKFNLSSDSASERSFNSGSSSDSNKTITQDSFNKN
jgi:hypothetical protein